MEATEIRLAQPLLAERLPMWVLDAATLRILDANEAALRLFGYGREAFLGLRVTDLRAPEDVPRYIGFLSTEEAASGRGQVWRMVTREGEALQLAISHLAMEGGGALLAVATPLEAPPRPEDETDPVRRLYDQVLEIIPGGVAHVSTDGVILHANRRARELLGIRWESGHRRFTRDYEARVVDEDDRPTSLEERPYVRCLRTGEPQGPTVIGIRRDEDEAYMWAVYTASPIRDARTGAVMAVVMTFLDITELKEAEAQLRDSEANFRQLFEAIPDGVVVSADGRVVDANPAFLAMFGYGREEVLGRTVLDLVAEEDRETVTACIRSGKDKVYEATGIRKDGGRVDIEVHSSPCSHCGSEFARLSAVRDVTERKRQAATLAEEQAFCETALESLSGSFYAFDIGGRLLRWNRHLEEHSGYGHEEVARMAPLDFIAPEDRSRVLEAIDSAFREGVAHVEAQFLTKDGQRIPYYFTGRSFLYRGEPILVGMGLDITERVQAEAAFRQAQKLESLGILAGGIAHDFNNLLAAMSGNVDLAEMSLPRGSEAQAFLEQLHQAIRRAADLCQQMLAYSGKGRFVVKPMDLNALVREVTGLLKVSISKHAELVLDLQAELPAIEADPSQIQQALMNLVINASEAIGERPGRIRISTGLKEVKEKSATALPPGMAPEPGLHVCLEVKDTGCGMDAETLTKVFDPFFTTKFTGRGLGLAALQGIVRGNRGAVTVTSRPGEGTSFCLYFPVGRASEAEAPPAAEQAPWRGEGTVLVVDDEESLRRVLATLLEHLGYTVIQAADGREGLEAFTARADEVQVVFMDLTMPEMGGLEAARRILALRPGTRVILMSGYNAEEAGTHLEAEGIHGFLKKPFRLPEMVPLLKEALRA